MHEHIGSHTVICPPSDQSAHLRVQCVLGGRDEDMECQFSGGEGAWTSAWGWGISIRYCLQFGVWNQFPWEELDTVSLWTCPWWKVAGSILVWLLSLSIHWGFSQWKRGLFPSRLTGHWRVKPGGASLGKTACLIWIWVMFCYWTNQRA